MEEAKVEKGGDEQEEDVQRLLGGSRVLATNASSFISSFNQRHQASCYFDRTIFYPDKGGPCEKPLGSRTHFFILKQDDKLWQKSILICF